MTKIWKYKLRLTSRQTINVPQGAKLQHIDIIPSEIGSVFLWLKVDPDASLIYRDVFMFATGESIETNIIDSLQPLGTVITPHVNEVYHFFWNG